MHTGNYMMALLVALFTAHPDCQGPERTNAEALRRLETVLALAMVGHFGAEGPPFFVQPSLTFQDRARSDARALTYVKVLPCTLPLPPGRPLSALEAAASDVGGHLVACLFGKDEGAVRARPTLLPAKARANVQHRACPRLRVRPVALNHCMCLRCWPLCLVHALPRSMPHARPHGALCFAGGRDERCGTGNLDARAPGSLNTLS